MLRYTVLIMLSNHVDQDQYPEATPETEISVLSPTRSAGAQRFQSVHQRAHLATKTARHSCPVSANRRMHVQEARLRQSHSATSALPQLATSSASFSSASSSSAGANLRKYASMAKPCGMKMKKRYPM